LENNFQELIPLSALAIFQFGGGKAAAELENELKQLLQSGLLTD